MLSKHFSVKEGCIRVKGENGIFLCVMILLCFLWLEIDSYYVAEAHLKLMIFLPLFPTYEKFELPQLTW